MRAQRRVFLYALLLTVGWALVSVHVPAVRVPDSDLAPWAGAGAMLTAARSLVLIVAVAAIAVLSGGVQGRHQ